MDIYFKVTNKEECHNGFQYCDGLNILVEPFNDDPNASCCAGGLYFTTAEYIHHFYDFGIYIRLITLPKDDHNFRTVKDPQGDKWRVNRIILGEKYDLDDVQTYEKLGILLPSLRTACDNKFYNVVKYILENGHCDKNDRKYVFTKCVDENNTEMIYYMLEKGVELDIINNVLPIIMQNENFELMETLITNGADIHGDNDFLIRHCISCDYIEATKFLIKKGANVRAGGDFIMHMSAQNGHFEILKMVIERGSNVHSTNDLALYMASKHGHIDIVKYLVYRGANVNCANSRALIAAILYGHDDIVLYLVKKGADVNMVDKDIIQRYVKKINIHRFLTKRMSNNHGIKIRKYEKTKAERKLL